LSNLTREAIVSKKRVGELVALASGIELRVVKSLAGLRYANLLDWWTNLSDKDRTLSANDLVFKAKIATAALLDENGDYMFDESEYPYLLEQEWLSELVELVFQRQGWAGQDSGEPKKD